MRRELVALLDGKAVGRVLRDSRGRMTFVYDASWQQADDAYPLSLSMPLQAQEHRHAVIEAFLWGLLPDNELVLDRWARKFQVSARNVFALISNVGEDCAGAVQFVTPERIKSLVGGKDDGIEWLDERGIAERLRLLREDHAAWRLPRDTGQFSLAGAQPKTAFFFERGRWGIPRGRIPTTHILKPPTGHFDGHAENEHICLALARSAGLPAALSEVVRFEKEIAIAVQPYDRVRTGKTVLRIHQEDICQALAILPSRKYQSEKGPSPADIVELLRVNSSNRDADVETFVAALAFNWLIAGTDAHAKNYSLLIGDGQIRLAPLYDIASILPYERIDIQKAKLAMKIGGNYRLRDIGVREWLKFAQEMRVEPDALMASLRAMTARLPDLLNDAITRAREAGLKLPVIGRLGTHLTERFSQCARLLDAGTDRL